MAELYNTAAPKKAANLSVNSDLLRKTRELNINLSATLERALKEELSKREAEQFDVYPNPSKVSKAHYPYLVDIQSSLLSDLATRIVIPLGKRSAFGGEAMQGLTPEISFADQELLLLTPQISSVAEKHLKSPVGSLSHFRDQIVGALDMAITGI
jgi:toxin CcdB